MSDKLTALFDKFVSEARSLLIAETQAMLGNMAGPGGSGQPDPVIKAKAKPGPKPKAAKAVARTKGAKRTPEIIAEQTATVLAWLRKNPNSRSEQISAGTGIVTKDLVIPIKTLIDDKSLAKPKGLRRGTTYAAR